MKKFTGKLASSLQLAARSARNKKGQGAMIEQLFVVLFGVFLLVMVVAVFTNLRGKSFEFIGSSQLERVANYVHDGIIIADQNMRVSDTGKIFLDLPDRVGDTSYKIQIINNTINVTDLAGSINASVGVFNINATVAGNISSGGGGRIFLSYNKSSKTITLEAEERILKG